MYGGSGLNCISSLKHSKAPLVDIQIFKLSAAPPTTTPSCSYSDGTVFVTSPTCQAVRVRYFTDSSRQVCKACVITHILNEETEVQRDKATCPNATADPGLQRPFSSQCTWAPRRVLRTCCVAHSPFPAPTALQLLARWRFLLPSGRGHLAHTFLGPISCRQHNPWAQPRAGCSCRHARYCWTPQAMLHLKQPALSFLVRT